MRAPQIIMIMLLTMRLTVTLIMHGKPVRGNHSFFITAGNIAITIALLYWGGFFG